MPNLIVALATCSDTLELAPLLAHAELGGFTLQARWLAGPEERRAAHELGLPPAAHDATAPLTGESWVLLAGYGERSQAFALQARHAGATVLRWNAGQRDHDPHGNDAERRLCDHLAHLWLCATTWQADELRREGCAAAHVHVVGSLLPKVADAAGADGRGVWLALEHTASLQDPEQANALLAAVAAAAAADDLVVHAGGAALQAALQRGALRVPAAMHAQPLSPLAQLQRARSAAAIVTDSAGYQELAAAAGIGCVLLRRHTARPETVHAGLCRLAAEPEQIAAALHDLLAPRAPVQVYGEALQTVPALLAQLHNAAERPKVATPTSPATQPTRLTLPSDGDHTGRTLGDDEVALASAAIRSGTLNSTRGTFVTGFERQFAQWQGSKHAIACANGSAAVHAALAALELQAGDEVVTTSITDMGALTPILYQGAVPVFADVDARTRNVTAESVAAQLTDRTRAIVVTHLFGLPAELDAICRLANDRGIAVIEDCAQAFGALHQSRKVGTWGKLAAFSLQQGKHITAGEGGIVTTDDDTLARRVFLFVNKAWGYGDPKPDHYFPALNYRLTELQGAVLTAQLPKLDGVIERRRQVAAALRQRLAGLRGLGLPDDPPGGRHVYWKFAIDVDPAAIDGGALALGRGLQERGVACAPRYVQKPAFACALFTDWRQAAVTRLPLEHNPRGKLPSPWPAAGDLPGTIAALDRVLVLPLNERYLPHHIEHVAEVIATRHRELCRD